MSIATLALPLVLALAQSDDEPSMLRWDRSLDGALEKAKSSNSFVFIAFPDDFDGEGRDALLGAFWTHRGLRKAVAAGRAVVASPYKHVEHESGLDRDGGALERYCSRFGQLVCEQHREVEKQALSRYFEGVDPVTRPVFLVVRGSDGAVLARRVGDPTATELAETVQLVASIVKESGEPAVPSELLGRALDADEKTRSRALHVLASLEFPAADAARKKLLDDSKDDKHRAEILDAVADCGSRTFREVALAQLESKATIVRAAAARALGAPGKPDAVEPLVKSFTKAKDDDERKWIVRALGRCARASEPGRDMLRKAAADNRAIVRANACIALGEAGAGDAAVVKLLKQKAESDPDAKVRGAAAYALTTMRGVDSKDAIAFFRQRKPKEKDAKVIEMLNAGVTFLEGTHDGDLSWALQNFCGDSAR
jgi:hypothetical protein